MRPLAATIISVMVNWWLPSALSCMGAQPRTKQPSDSSVAQLSDDDEDEIINAATLQRSMYFLYN